MQAVVPHAQARELTGQISPEAAALQSTVTRMGNNFYGGVHHHYPGGTRGVDRQPDPPPVDTRSVWRQHPIVGTLTFAIMAFIALGVVINFWYVFVPLAVVGVGGYFGIQRAKAQRAENAALSARAQAEHEAYMRGSEVGMFGRFPPEV